ncbi:MAG TPA: response regulator transcription factor [Flavobacteriales bacterium]
MGWEILLADDHTIIRRGVRDLIRDRIPGVHQVREVGSCAELLAELRKQVPHLLVLDLDMGDGNAIELLDLFRLRHTDMRVLVFSMAPENLYAQRTASLGSVGYLRKGSTEEEMVQAFRQVLRGECYVSHEEEMRRLDQGEGMAQTGFQGLSDRELMVMHELLKGFSVVEIAAKGGLKPNTVTTYKARLFDKLGVKNILELQRLVEESKP